MPSITAFLHQWNPFKGSGGADSVSVMLIISRWSATLSSLITAVVLARWLKPEGYGNYAQVWLSYALFAQVCITALSSTALQKLGTSSDYAATISNLDAFSKKVAVAISVLIALLAWPMARFWGNQLLFVPILGFIPYMALSVAASPMEALFIARSRKGKYVRFSALYHSTNVLIVFAAFLITKKLEWVFLIMGIGPVMQYAFYSYHLRGLKSPDSYESMAEIGPIKKLFMTLLITTFLGIAAKEADKWLVANWVQEASDYAFYVLGAKKIPLIAGLTSSLAASLLVSFKAHSEQPWQNLERQVSTYIHRFFPLLSAVIVLSNLLAPYIIQLLYGGAYDQAIQIFKWYQWGILGDLLFGLTIYLLMDDRKAIIVLTLSELLFKLLLTLLLLQQYGSLGATIAYVITHILFSAFGIIFSCRKYGVQIASFFPSFFDLIYSCIAAAILVLSFKLTHQFFEALWLQLGLTLAIFCVIAFILLIRKIPHQIK